MYHRFRITALIEGSQPESRFDADNWRTVTVVRTSPMMTPSAATLKKHLYDWDRKEKEGGVPPVQVRWGTEQEAALRETSVPVPRVQQDGEELKLPHPIPEAAEAPTFTGEESGKPGSSASGFPIEAIRTDSSAGNGATVYLPPPGTAPAPPAETSAAASTAPASIPKPPAEAALVRSEPATKVFENEQKAIHSEGSGLFDTKGFPLGEYANQIIERIKGNWLIPSHLRNSQGRTTVVFFIDRNGRFADARIVLSSGSDSLDLAALNAVIVSNPFPPLPKGFPGDHIGAKFIFSYNEHQ